MDSLDVFVHGLAIAVLVAESVHERRERIPTLFILLQPGFVLSGHLEGFQAECQCSGTLGLLVAMPTDHFFFFGAQRA